MYIGKQNMRKSQTRNRLRIQVGNRVWFNVSNILSLVFRDQLRARNRDHLCDEMKIREIYGNENRNRKSA